MYQFDGKRVNSPLDSPDADIAGCRRAVLACRSFDFTGRLRMVPDADSIALFKMRRHMAGSSGKCKDVVVNFVASQTPSRVSDWLTLSTKPIHSVTHFGAIATLPRIVSSWSARSSGARGSVCSGRPLL